MSDTRRSAFLDGTNVLSGSWEGNESYRPLEFSFRPMNAIENAAYVQKLSQAKTPDQIAGVVCEMLAERLGTLEEWDSAHNLLPVPHTAADLAKLDANALYAIQRMVERSAQSLEEARKNY